MLIGNPTKANFNFYCINIENNERILLQGTDIRTDINKKLPLGNWIVYEQARIFFENDSVYTATRQKIQIPALKLIQENIDFTVQENEYPSSLALQAPKIQALIKKQKKKKTKSETPQKIDTDFKPDGVWRKITSDGNTHCIVWETHVFGGKINGWFKYYNCHTLSKMHYLYNGITLDNVVFDTLIANKTIKTKIIKLKIEHEKVAMPKIPQQYSMAYVDSLKGIYPTVRDHIFFNDTIRNITFIMLEAIFFKDLDDMLIISSEVRLDEYIISGYEDSLIFSLEHADHTYSDGSEPDDVNVLAHPEYFRKHGYDFYQKENDSTINKYKMFYNEVDDISSQWYYRYEFKENHFLIHLILMIILVLVTIFQTLQKPLNF